MKIDIQLNVNPAHLVLPHGAIIKGASAKKLAKWHEKQINHLSITP